MKPKIWQQMCVLSLLPAFTGYTQAAGFKVNEYSTSALGAANSAGAAQANDATTVFSNPAGMTQLSKQQVIGNFSLIDIDAEFSNNGSFDAAGQPVAGSSGGNAAPLLHVPAGYWVKPLNDTMAVGLGITVPYGLTTEYNSSFVGRYGALESELLTVDFNPSFAMELSDNFSVGFGVSARYADVTLSNAIEYGAVCFSALAPTLGAAAPAACVANGLAPQAVDGTVELAGDDWGFGYNIGVLYHTDSFKVGAQYRSKVEFDLEGDANFTNPAIVNAVLGAGGAFADTGITAELNLPETWNLSAAWMINSQWTIMADYLHTQWSRFRTLAVEFDNPAQPDLVEKEHWDNVARISVGTEYKHNDQWTFRAGIGHDESPVPDEYARPRIPDSDRFIYAVGFAWSPDQHWTVDAAYNLLIADDSDLASEGNYGETLIGSYDSTKVNLLSVGLTYTF
ncbi:OmpP1/FadL family transporter [Halioxenophilus aromaticivorans]|uniref:Outer membrane protein transport protein n=1 Tax=Halioxenophilus aromaticivorans TaxID=1306992 RepID=A0AAV3U1U8_9ALTE